MPFSLLYVKNTCVDSLSEMRFHHVIARLPNITVRTQLSPRFAHCCEYDRITVPIHRLIQSQLLNVRLKAQKLKAQKYSISAEGSKVQG